MKLQLLGAPRVRFGEYWTEQPPSRPMLLVFYLALERTWVSREELAFFFRPDADEAVARHYVRKMLSYVRQLPWAYDLEVEKDRLRWQVDTDVTRFHDAARAGRYGEALSLYRGPLLGHLHFDKSPSFEAWLEYRREALETLWHDVCLSQVAEFESAGNHREAAGLARELLQRDSLAEDALRSYVRNSYLAGRRDLALQAATTFRQELERETGLEPLLETTRLIEAVERSEPVARATSQRKTGRRLTDRPPPSVEERQLSELLELLHDPQVRLLDITDGPNAGKLVVARRVPDVSAALQAVVNLAEGLVSQHHHARASDMLLLVLKHPLCDTTTSMKAQRIRTYIGELAEETSAGFEEDKLRLPAEFSSL